MDVTFVYDENTDGTVENKTSFSDVDNVCVLTGKQYTISSVQPSPKVLSIIREKCYICTNEECKSLLAVREKSTRIYLTKGILDEHTTSKGFQCSACGEWNNIAYKFHKGSRQECKECDPNAPIFYFT